MSLRATMTGMERTKASMRAVPGKVRNLSDATLPKSSRVMLAHIRRLAPRDTLALTRSLKERLVKGKTQTVAVIGPMPGLRFVVRSRGKKSARVVEPAEYAPHVERRRSFMRRAFTEAQARTQADYAAKMSAAIARERF